MGLFGFGKKGSDIVDLAERYRKQKEREEMEKTKTVEKTSSSGIFSFFDSASNSKSEQDNEEVLDLTNNTDEKKKKFAKRLVDMTEKLEELSNSIYHLQQRIEVLEKKANVNRLD
ncbi:hypothetical protein FJZ20_01210 [Candidatus Pacearchaeota archaeon]|nr:hypothetical protein [Candidatus Pacearchaeota archaeon]